jgi:hypothetical protein
MKINIKFFFVLAFSVLLLSCKKNQESFVSPKVENEVRNYLFSLGNGVLKENVIQPYILFSEENKPYESDLNQAPDSIINLSKKYIYNSIGESYYNLHLEYRSSIKLSENWYTYNMGGRYTVTHYYKIVIKDFVTNLIVATYHDSLGRVLANEGVVSRLKDTTLGMPFNIDDFKAVVIAKADGFESGYFPWHVTFQYDGTNRVYVWVIKNQTGSKAGNDIKINAQTGNIIERLSWRVIINKNNA